MLYGTIKNVAPNRGFGFIEPSGSGLDVYFHATVIGDDVFQRLRPGQAVKYELVKLTEAERERRRELKEKPKPKAGKIELIDKLPGGILPRPTQDIAPRHHPKARQRKATWKRKIDLSEKNKKS
ncbi:MAG TPA: cold shock domain-containing protein [Pirellulaceae bacterium]|nr:cold shock domain-containing protein [Pirellulaceae bacterium]